MELLDQNYRWIISRSKRNTFFVIWDIYISTLEECLFTSKCFICICFFGPAIVAGAATLGVMQQIIRAFGRVEGSMQYILKAWPTIIELASVYKRLREFETKILKTELSDQKI